MTTNGRRPSADDVFSEDVVAALANHMFRDGLRPPEPDGAAAASMATAPAAVDVAALPTTFSLPLSYASHASPAVVTAPNTGTPMAWAGPGPDVLDRLRGGLGAAPPSTTPAVPRRTTALPATQGHVDPYRLRHDFPALHQQVNGKPLVWLDNAATTQKPQSVIDALATFYEHDNSNVHRGAHALAARATDAYEGAREKVRQFIGAADAAEVIFVRGTTEAINLVAQSYGRSVVGPGDEVVVTELEHHSNIVPWQLLCAEKGATLRVAPIDDRGELDLERYAQLLGPRTKIVAMGQVSNALGTVVPVEVMARMAHAVGARVVVDGAQGVPHHPVDVQALGADFFAFSGHKLFGPTGIGVLWGRRELLEQMPPWQGGGQMIKTVTFDALPTWNDLPYKFEAGTGIIAGAVGLGAAIDYVGAVGLPGIAAYEHTLLEQAIAALGSIKGVRLIGTAAARAAVVSFVLDGMSVEQVGRYLDTQGIAVRAGHHCAQPALRHFGLEATVRPSLAFYNTQEDVELLGQAVYRVARRAGVG